MSRAEPGNRKRARLLPLHVLLLGAGTAMFGGALPLFAQETSALRGAVAEDEINSALLGRPVLENRRTPLDRAASADTENAPVPQYRPASPGAVADEAETDRDPQSLFEGERSASEDAFSDAAPLPPSAPPSTARQRAEAARERASQPPQTAAERQEADEQEEEQAEEDLTTGTVRADTIDSEIDLTVDPGSERAEAIEGLDPTVEENPYAPLGLRVGTFIVTPTLESGVTWTSNADSSPDGSEAFLSETALRLNAISDWSSHSATIEAYGTLRKSISGQELDEKELGVSGAAEFELGNEFRATAAAGYVIRPESASSPVVIVGTVSRPIRQTLNGGLGLEKDVGKLRLGATVDVERDWYGDADLSSGGVLSQRDRNATLTTVSLRGGYEISPAVTPFVEIEVGKRIYEEDVDTSGYARSSDRLGARAGVALDLGEKLLGEVSAGWVRETLEDDRLAPISGATIDADLAWSPMRGTTVTLAGSTIVEGTTTPGESGSILYASRLTLERQMRANLTGNVALGAAWRNYAGSDGHDQIFSAEAGMTYWLNRYAGLTGRARYETLRSNLPDRDSETSSMFLGLKLQR